MSAPTVASPRPRYLRWWAAVPRSTVYLLVSFPIAVAGFAVTLTLLNTGLGTIITFFIGLILIVAGLYVARGFGAVERALLRWTGLPEIPPPDWRDDHARRGFLGWIGAVIGNGHYWMHLLWAALVDFVVSTITFALTVTWVATAAGGLTYGIWERFLPDGDGQVYPAYWLLRAIGLPVDGTPRVVDVLAYLVLGLIFAATLPVVLRGLVRARWGIARGMLGAFASDRLRREVSQLSESRAAAASAEGGALRRLERDLHDGPQQRLVRLQMDLSSAARSLDTDPERARVLLAEAEQQSREALEELRAVSRGFAPPLLLDRGLRAALEGLAARSVAPTRFVDELPAGIELPVEVERNLYFVAAEALTNAAKHARAGSAEVRIGMRRVPEGDAWIDLSVRDDGPGGAAPRSGHGLEGLDERVRGMGGTLEVSSPVGGPTVVSAHVPLAD